MRHRLPIILLLVFAIGFVLGLLELFQLRLDTGDVYPPYSTLRADPLGTSAYYESLSKMPDLSVSRDFRMTDEMPEESGVTYLHLAGERREWEELPEDTYKQIDAFVRAGGRLVVAIFPEQARRRVSQFTPPGEIPSKSPKPDGRKIEEKPADAKPAKTPRNRNRPANRGDELIKMVSVVEKWGLGMDLKNLNQGADGSYEPITVTNGAEPTLPRSLTWHSGVVMTNLDAAWRVIYARGSDAVLAERKFGSGSVVVATDCYFLSNEAMQKDRQAKLLAWLIGPERKVMFDEAHLGIVEETGIAMLMRKYRLGGLALALLGLAGLFIWKNALGFGPVRETEAAETWVAGKDSAAGFINLLRHHIKPDEVLKTAYTEWQKSAARGTFDAARRQRVEEFFQSENARPARERDAVRAYQTMAKLLAKTRGPAANVVEFKNEPDSKSRP